MNNREAIVRKLNALKAKFEHSATGEVEALAAMSMYNKLMQQYNLTEDDLHVRQSGIHGKTFKHGQKQRGPMYWVVVGIGKVTDTRPINNPKTNECLFLGTQADIQYAEFLYRLIEGTLNTVWKAYRFSYEYTKLNQTTHGREIKNSFEKGFAFRMSERLMEMANENKTVGTGLIVLKNQLIQSFLNEQGVKTKQTKAVVKYNNTSDAFMTGINQADKVRLRQEAEDQTPLKLEHKPCD